MKTHVVGLDRDLGAKADCLSTVLFNLKLGTTYHPGINILRLVNGY